MSDLGRMDPGTAAVRSIRTDGFDRRPAVDGEGTRRFYRARGLDRADPASEAAGRRLDGRGARPLTNDDHADDPPLPGVPAFTKEPDTPFMVRLHPPGGVGG